MALPGASACLKLAWHLGQDALERAYNRDVDGARGDAIKLYRMGLNIIYEGLSLRVQSSGLGAGYSNVAKWRDEMNRWQQHVLDRLASLLCTVHQSTVLSYGASHMSGCYREEDDCQ